MKNDKDFRPSDTDPQLFDELESLLKHQTPKPPTELGRRIGAEIPETLRVAAPRRRSVPWLGLAAGLLLALAIFTMLPSPEPTLETRVESPTPVAGVEVEIDRGQVTIDVELEPIGLQPVESTRPRPIEIERLTPAVVPASNQGVGVPTGTITGTVTYQGSALPGVTVTVTSPNLMQARRAVSQDNGDYIFRLLPSGEYVVTFELGEFQTLETKVLLPEAQTRSVIAQMSSESLSETLEVTASLSNITMTTESGVLMNQDTLKNLPIGRTLPSAALQSGVQAPPPSTGGTAEPNDEPYGDVFYAPRQVNPFVDPEDDPLSTFGLDVDTGSYAVARRYLSDGNMPPPESVRVEEWLNSFDYGDHAPEGKEDIRIAAEGAPTLFGEGERYAVVRFGIAARDIVASERPPLTLIFVIDVSGSMSTEDRLGQVKRSLHMLSENLQERDRVGLVTYGSVATTHFAPNTDRSQLRTAIDSLVSGGSTNAEDGLRHAYSLARESRRPGDAIRLILCSDGVANVGRTGPDSILEEVRKSADEGIELSSFGFGMGNYNDQLMERLANTGDGAYAYIDSEKEARKHFSEAVTGTLFTVAREAKVQVAFNPDAVRSYRLLGYENRAIADDRFRDDTVDAGEIGAGHRVTALYEVKLKRRVRRRAELATLTLRYFPVDAEIDPRDAEAVERSISVYKRDLARSWDEAPESLRLASLIAESAERFKQTIWSEPTARGFSDILLHTDDFGGTDAVDEWIDLLRKANELIED